MIAAAERHQLLEIDSHFGAVLGEIVIHQAGVEQVDAGRHGRVRGEDVAGARRLQRLVEGQARDRACSTRICSSARNAEWPSFMWKTVGFSPIAFSARMPPMPSTISCRMRVSISPP